MDPRIAEIEKEYIRADLPSFSPGDTVRVRVRVREGDKERIQPFEGICIAKRGAGVNATFTLRRVSGGVGVERIFPMHSPWIAGLEVVRRGDVRRAKLYYLRTRRGKRARVRERKWWLDKNAMPPGMIPPPDLTELAGEMALEGEALEEMAAMGEFGDAASEAADEAVEVSAAPAEAVDESAQAAPEAAEAVDEATEAVDEATEAGDEAAPEAADPIEPSDAAMPSDDSVDSVAPADEPGVEPVEAAVGVGDDARPRDGDAEDENRPETAAE